MIFAECVKHLNAQSKVTTVRCFKKCDTDELTLDLMNAPWQVMDTFDTVDDMWDYWKTLFFQVLDKHAPLKKVRLRKRGQDDEWIDSELRGLMRTRNYYRNKHRKTHAKDDWDKYKALRREVNTRIRRAKTEHYRNVCADISGKSRSTWRQLNLALGRTKRRAVSLINWEGKTLTDHASIVNTFVQHFSTVAVPSPSTFKCQITPVSTSFSFKKITEEDVLKKLSGLDERKATGPDMIPAKLLKIVAPAISTSLTKLFNYSLSQGVFPLEWKQANVMPVPKSGDRHMVNNYRPISVIPVIAKVFESMVHGQLYEYLGRNKILSEEQTGFRPNR